MNQFKKAQVVMLLTENTNRLLYLSTDVIPNLLSNWRGKAQELYIISNDKIKEGDWILRITDNKLFRHNPDYYNHNVEAHGKGICKKIIATTDSSLTLSDQYHTYDILPQPSQQFIEQYIESYNKGEVITDVLVEYIKCCGRCLPNIDECQGTTLKINSNNTITIKQQKDNWNKEEICKLIRKAITDTNKIGFRNISMDYNEWIEENL